MILDVGSGGVGYEGAISRGDVCVDIRKSITKLANFVQADAHFLPFVDNTFDLAYFYDVIEHINSPIKCLKEICRVLKPNGKLQLSTPNPLHWRNFLRALRGKDILLTEKYPDHIATWTDAELKNILVRAGFNNITFRFTILDVTKRYDSSHMKYDLPLFKLGFHRVTGRTIIASANKSVAFNDHDRKP